MQKLYSEKQKLRIAILLSGRGSNMEAIIRRRITLPHVEIAAVISDNPDAHGLTIASNLEVNNIWLDPGQHKTKLSKKAEKTYIDFLLGEKVDLICLAGFMRILSRSFIKAFKNRIINIHPSLLPKYPGLNTHERALKAKEPHSGCSVHFVDEGIDTGTVIRQRVVPINANDTPEKLAKRILKQEHILYPEIIREISMNKITIG